MHLDEEREQPSNERSPPDRTHRVTDDLDDDASRRRAERVSDANLHRAARDRVGDDGVDADRRQNEEERPEHSEHPRRNASQKEILLDMLIQRTDIVQHELRIELADGAPQIGSEELDASTGAHMNLAHGCRAVAIGEVQRRRRLFAKRVVE